MEPIEEIYLLIELPTLISSGNQLFAASNDASQLSYLCTTKAVAPERNEQHKEHIVFVSFLFHISHK